MIPFEHPNPLQMPEAVQPYPNIPRVPQEVVITREVSTEPAEPPAHPRPEPDIRITGPDDRGHTEVPTPTMPLPVAATPPSPSMANTGAEKNDADEPGAADIPPPESPAPAEPANDAPAAPPEESPSDAIAESPSDDPPPASGFPPRAAEIIDTLRYNFTGGTGLSE